MPEDSGRVVLHSPRTPAVHVLRPKHGLARIVVCLSSSLIMPSLNLGVSLKMRTAVYRGCFIDRLRFAYRFNAKTEEPHDVG